MDLTYPACQKVRRKHAKKVDSLYSVVETSVNKGSEMFFNHTIHLFNQNGILRLEKLVARVSPLFNCLLYKPLSDNEWIIVRKFPSFRPAPHLSDRMVDTGRFNLLHCHVHNLVDVDGTIIRTQFRFLCRKEGWRVVVHPLPGFVWPEVGSGLLDGVLKPYVERPNDLVDSFFVGCTIHERGKRSRETRDHLDDLADGVARWRLWKSSKPELSLFENILQLLREFREPKEAQRLSTYDNTRKGDRTHLRLMRSERILLKDSVRFRVPNLFWQYVSAVDHGEVLAKKFFSWARASAHVIPVLRALDPGCLTVNHPFASGSASFRMKRSQLSSSPCGIRSGLVKTPVTAQSTSKEAEANIPMVRFPSGSYCFAMWCAP